MGRLPAHSNSPELNRPIMLNEPQPTAYDLQFEIFGYRVRVSPWFWLVAVVLGLEISRGVSNAFGEDSPGAPVLLLIWIAAIFTSILVHELGHSLAFSYYGTQSRIVLYHFGGLAIPDSYGAWNAARRRHVGADRRAGGPAQQQGVRVEALGEQVEKGFNLCAAGLKRWAESEYRRLG